MCPQPALLLPPCIRLLMILSFGGGCPEGLMFPRVFGSAGQFLGCSRNSDCTDFKNKGRNPEPFCENSQGKPFPTSPLLSPSLPSCPLLFPPFPFFSSPPPPLLFSFGVVWFWACWAGSDGVGYGGLYLDVPKQRQLPDQLATLLASYTP